jgi:ankyrin repeat protein
MPRKKKGDSRHQAEYYSEMRRLEEQQGGGNHTMSMLLNAAQRHDEDFLLYLTREIGVNYAEAGKTALFWLSGDDDPRAVELLVQAGSKVNAAQTGAASPLMHAAFNNRLHNVRLLVQHGAELGYCDANGDSALSLAEAQGHTDVVNYLNSVLAIKP